MEIKIFESFEDALTYNNTVQETDKELLYAYLYKKWYRPEIVGEIDILTKASLLFLLVLNTLETRGRSDKVSSRIALDYLQYLNLNNEEYFVSIGIEKCVPYLHENPHFNELTPSVSYTKLGQYLCVLNESINNPNIKIDRALWQTIYLIVQAIYLKDIRFAGTWYQVAISFYENFVLEDSLTTHVPGLSFYDRGVRHDKFCPVSGTRDPDFWYTASNGTKAPAEFKRATKTVEALAGYGFNNPDYIYNAKFLFTYGRTKTGVLGFYKIDYTVPQYTIEAVDVDDQLIEVIKAVGDKVYENNK